MARTTITHDEPQVDALRRIYGDSLSRSELYRRAAREVISRHEAVVDEDAIERAVARGVTTALDEWEGG